MEKAKILVVYNLLNANGDKLQLRLGTVREFMTREDAKNGDTGLRWSFVGRKIPMPIRAYTWFNGFPEETMLEWLKANGWYPKTCVDMYTGKAKVYALPTVNGDGIPELKIETSAKKAYDDAIPVALENAMNDISKAKDDGRTGCYISTHTGKIPTEVIETLLNAGYDIKYTVFNKGYGDWFVQVFWDRPCKRGKLFKGGSFDDPIEISIQDYKNA